MCDCIFFDEHLVIDSSLLTFMFSFRERIEDTLKQGASNAVLIENATVPEAFFLCMAEIQLPIGRKLCEDNA